MSGAEGAHRTGRRGEQAAAQMVRERGWQVVARNLRIAGGEADIVAVRARDGLQQGLIAEVKSSRSAGQDLATRAGRRQRARLFEMAEALVEQRDLDEAHVALITVQLGVDRVELSWVELEPF